MTCNSLVSRKEKEDSARLWHMQLGHAGEKEMMVLSKLVLLKVAKSCKLVFCEHCVLDQQTWVKFGTIIHCKKGCSIMFTRTSRVL